MKSMCAYHPEFNCMLVDQYELIPVEKRIQFTEICKVCVQHKILDVLKSLDNSINRLRITK